VWVPARSGSLVDDGSLLDVMDNPSSWDHEVSGGASALSTVALPEVPPF